MAHSYLRFGDENRIGVICGGSNSVVCRSKGVEIAVCGAVDTLLLWNLRSGTLCGRMVEEKNWEEKTGLEPSVSYLRMGGGALEGQVVAGYSEGGIKLWSVEDCCCLLNLNGHKGRVTYLAFNHNHHLLASGSDDNSIILWDLLAEHGLFRLSGHQAGITCLGFVTDNYLISSSKDGLLKVWDLETQHCIQTVVGHRSEIWSFALDLQRKWLASGTASTSLRFYHLKQKSLEEETTEETKKKEGEGEGEYFLEFFGEIERKGKERVVQLDFNPSHSLLSCLSNDSSLELFQTHSLKQIKKKQKRRRSRAKQKAIQKQTEVPEVAEITGTDVVTSLHLFKSDRKIKSFCFQTPLTNQDFDKVVVTMKDNSLEVMKVEEEKGISSISSIVLPGHRSDVRALALSSDDLLLMSTSKDSIKIWNIQSLQCIQTIESGYGLCGSFVPGNTNVVIGTKDGELEIYSIASSEKVFSVKGHNGSVWSLCLSPDLQGIISAGADNDVKIWNFALDEDPTNPQVKRLILTQAQTLKMSDEVLALCCSADNKLMAMSLLDTTIKVFFKDTMKFFLSLFGHKLPVLCLDISSDGNLLVSGSADKNVRIWGLDFGDCHKSLFVHSDSVMDVKFVPDTHHFFSAGKDKLIKYWDADKFQQIMKLEGHYGEVWSLAMSLSGTFLVSASHDRSIIVWNQTEHQLFLEEERESEMEALFEKSLENPLEKGLQLEVESSATHKKTLTTIKAGERILDALDLLEQEEKKLKIYQMELAEAEELKKTSPELFKEDEMDIPPPEPNLLMFGKSPHHYLLSVLMGIGSNQLEDALLVLPFSLVLPLFSYLDILLANHEAVELCSRCLFFLLKIHQSQIVTNKSASHTLQSLLKNCRNSISSYKNKIGFNKAAMYYLQQDIAQSTNTFFDPSQVDYNSHLPLSKRLRSSPL